MITTRAVIHAVTPEREWQRVVINLAKAHGWLVSAMNDSRELWWGTDKGIPDLIMARRGRVIFAELKSERGQLSKEQEAWIAALRLARIEAYIWRPRDEDLVNQVLR